MENLIISGGIRLEGKTRLQGSKNSSLPILAACAAVNGISVIHNCPRITDVDIAVAILERLGCRVSREGGTVTVDSGDINCSTIPEELMSEMRSSIIFLGALLARFGRGSATLPGGCEIGLRPIDMHIAAFRSMGVVIEESGGSMECTAPNGLAPCRISLSFPSVGATENIMLASLAAKGETVITNAAREPEIKDLADFLNECGAKIIGAGQSVIRIYGGRRLTGAEHRVIPDRIVASTYMACAAVTGGRAVVTEVEREHLAPVIPVFELCGCKIDFANGEMSVTAPKRAERIKYLRTMPYPGFPTDSQALVTAVAATARGTSIISERVFENRFRHVPELIKMGADIRVEDSCVAVVEGVPSLHGAKVTASDLRGGSALIAAALGARGESVIDGVRHVLRGCEDVCGNLSRLGADIKVINI
ncbi:MAG: UDP-N-acetylglucosamine 1-carboxyvinyltransferase [Clostridium sp.]|nr:UDP-N-acetylglucosamine 1-carboxyvinyltransferase [Clostridium sp.]MDY5896002.1 UDP-N-acetylglucosamine 1-carboxyvinyltransferase [Oscillospiraceae bacterium]